LLIHALPLTERVQFKTWNNTLLNSQETAILDIISTYIIQRRSPARSLKVAADKTRHARASPLFYVFDYYIHLLPFYTSLKTQSKISSPPIWL